jgi:hypothetical protein
MELQNNNTFSVTVKFSQECHNNVSTHSARVIWYPYPSMHAVFLKLLLLHLFLTFFVQDVGCAMTEAVNCQPVTWKPDLRPFHVRCVVDKNGTGTFFF